ncbi:MAG: hypothetical protein AAGI92_01835 [Pseudomonadota bacterium]
MAKEKPGQNEMEEARRIIGRVDAESETLGTSSFARLANRASDHLVANDADQTDAAEVWGKRVGRGLAVAAFAALAIWLLNWLMR